MALVLEVVKLISFIYSLISRDFAPGRDGTSRLNLAQLFFLQFFACDLSKKFFRLSSVIHPASRRTRAALDRQNPHPQQGIQCPTGKKS